MTAYTENDVFCRELFVYIHSTKISLDIFKENLVKTELQLEIIEENGKWCYFRQNNIKYSRKQVQPILSTIVKEISRL
jgi:hypothetical protein